MLRGREWRSYLREIESGAPDELSSRWLGETVRHATGHVPYFEALGLPPTAELRSFPLLTRRVLRERFSDLKSRDLGRRRWREIPTGGSTGEPVWMIRDRASLQWDHAADMYYLSTLLEMPVSFYLSHHRLFLWHRRARRRSAVEVAAKLLGQCTYLEPNTVSSDETLAHDVAIVNRARPAVIWAVSSSLYELARFARHRDIRIHRPRFIISSVDMLYPAMRETIEQAFGCPVYNYYGAVEVGRVAAECKHHRLHVFTFNNHVEVLDPENQTVAPGEEGRLVLTPLHNRAMPLVRYDIGDTARVSRASCPCGAPCPRLTESREE
jgi:phenylacetate-CoA ligase